MCTEWLLVDGWTLDYHACSHDDIHNWYFKNPGIFEIDGETIKF